MAEVVDVLLVGPYPPPSGGISAHVERLAQAIAARGLSVAVLNHFRSARREPPVAGDLRRNPWRYWRALRAAQARVVHYHHSRWSMLLACALALERGRASTLATVHGRELEPFLNSRVPGVAALTRRALGSFDVLVAVSAEIALSLREIGPPVELIPAYLPVRCDPARLSDEAQSFLGRGTNLVLAAYRLSLDGRGRTIYGLETAIAAFAAAARGRPDLHLAILLANPPRSRRARQRLAGLLGAVDEALRSRIGVFCGEPLAPALRHAAVYLRPTLTDGDAVSIREALAAGVPVLASDAVRRPPGVRVLGPEVSAWSEAILTALQPGQRPATADEGADAARRLMAIYERLGSPARREAEPVPA